MLVYQSDNSIHAEHVRVERYEDFHFIPHLHKDLEFILALSGEIQVLVNGRSETLRAGQLALVLSNQIHGFTTPAHSRVLVVNFSVGYVGSFVRAVEGKAGTRSVFDAGDKLCTWLAEVYADGQTPDALFVKATCYAVCAQYLRLVPLENCVNDNNSALHPLLRYVEQNYRENINMKTAAQAIGYNENYLSRYFHQAVRMNFRRYVNQYRVEYACQLLQQEDARLSDVALDCGFQNIRSFNRAFLECLGMTPSDFRKRHGLNG